MKVSAAPDRLEDRVNVSSVSHFATALQHSTEQSRWQPVSEVAYAFSEDLVPAGKEQGVEGPRPLPDAGMGATFFKMS